MDRWYIKALGDGCQVYQSLRELRDVRFQSDSGVIEDCLYIVAADVLTGDTVVLLPPGNSVMAVACGASPCPPPDFQAGRLFKLFVESYPIIPGYPLDAHGEQDYDDF